MGKTRRAVAIAVAVFTVMALSPIKALAYKVNDDHKIFGTAQVWTVLSEDAENSAVSAKGESGEDNAFGFKAKRLRFGFKGKLVDGLIGYKVQTEFAGTNAGLKDYIMTINPGNVSIAIGQFKPFITYDGLRSSTKLKSIERGKILRDVSGGFFVTNNSFRDLGVSVKAKKLGPATLLLSATNGTGAGSNRDVGGSVSSGAVFANGFGDAAYSAGVIVKLAGGMVRLNGSYSINKHDNAVLKADKGTAFDIDRTAYSVGAEVNLKDIGLWLDGEYASLERGSDDLSGEAQTKGYYVRAGFWAMPKQLEILARYENIEDEGIKAGSKGNSYDTTGYSIGVNYYIQKVLKTQLEYTTFDPDQGDSISSTRVAFVLVF